MAQRTPSRVYALRVVVRFHGDVVDDRVFPRRSAALEVGPEGDVILPPPHGAMHLARIHWAGASSIEVETPGGKRSPLGPHDTTVLGFSGVRVHFELVPQFRLPRPPLLAESDFGLALSVLAMVVLALQVQLFQTLFPGQEAASEVGIEPTPELIARLLQDDLTGEDRGVLAESDVRPDSTKEHPSFYMPAGNMGPSSNLGGADRTAPEPVRTNNREAPTPPEFQPLEPEVLPLGVHMPNAMPDAAVPGVTDEKSLALAVEETGDEGPKKPLAAEETRGWGFHAWYDADDARSDDDEIREEILLARARLAIDPEDPYALQTLGYYQYLADLYPDCLATYERFIELYPEEPSGYNNLALVYKREKQYSKEEAYYRLALALSPADDHALNNLAVNLAHQGRHDEALKIMVELETMIPEDPYADLHRSKIYASMGENAEALAYLEKALDGMKALDTLHHIEFRADIRVDPAFESLREEPEFDRLLLRYYGADARPLTRAGGASG